MIREKTGTIHTLSGYCCYIKKRFQLNWFLFLNLLPTVIKKYYHLSVPPEVWVLSDLEKFSRRIPRQNLQLFSLHYFLLKNVQLWKKIIEANNWPLLSVFLSNFQLNCKRITRDIGFCNIRYLELNRKPRFLSLIF